MPGDVSKQRGVHSMNAAVEAARALISELRAWDYRESAAEE